MSSTVSSLPHVPAHLRRFVVEQDYSKYTAVDQAVWRFVLLQTHARLVQTAHPAYREGLAATGISVERIPSINEMNDKLSRFGWGAVCVDGFIPPRAFQEFQARGLLPIAADMRTRDHLVYTPAPDIIHEAAGHAPILPDPTYAAYLRRFGEIGEKAFSLPEEGRVFQAIFSLSEVKEDPGSSPEMVRCVESELEAALGAVTETSEAARLSRLYWWTSEYGLVGRPDDYKLYGAGLLSSLWESHTCHDPGVRKLPLDERCTEVSYDITKPQPQLFVARDFTALHEVLERVSRTLSFAIGGDLAFDRAIRSRELASVRFSNGAWVMGVLSHKGRGWLELSGSVAFAWDGLIPAEHRELARPTDPVVVTGALARGTTLDELDDGALRRLRVGDSDRHRFGFASGALVEGTLERSVRDRRGRLLHVELTDARLSFGDRATLALPRYRLLALGDPVTAHAGAVDPSYHGETAFSGVRVPKARELSETERSLVALYDRAARAHAEGAAGVAREFPRVHAALSESFPDEWLLRWNLLESLLKARDPGELATTLEAELERLEVAFDYRQPIASGLRYLAKVAA
ncbi:MAG TPA: aromatic amino acid hydroxylase [Polyangiaceae bacterium]|nr:aromatic amino acid hydroxylase [Polyangiaceae bacterium]